MIWPLPWDELYSFVEALNVHDSLKFTVDINETHVNFLDVTIYKDPNINISTDTSAWGQNKDGNHVPNNNTSTNE